MFLFPSLALSERAILGGQRADFCDPTGRDRAVAAPGAGLLANRTRGLGCLRSLCHFPFPAGARWILPLQRASTALVLRRGVRPGSPGDCDGALDVASLDEPFPLVSGAARQPADRTVAPLPHHVRLRRLPHYPCGHG